MTNIKLQRLGMIMEPQPGNSFEADGVLNPRQFADQMGSFIYSPPGS